MQRVKVWMYIASFTVILALLTGLPPVLDFPHDLRLLPGQEYVLRTGPLFTVYETGACTEGTILVNNGKRTTLQPTVIGQHKLQLRVLGLLTIRAASIDVVPEIKVMVGGHSVGILLSDTGLLVVRTASIQGADGNTYRPATDAGILPGDILLKIGDADLVHPSQLEEQLTAYGSQQQPMPILVQRGPKKVNLRVTPILGKDPQDSGYRYMLGLYLRDPIAGVGTLTFWDPVSDRYGALGHMITGDEREPLAVANGMIVPAYIHGIQPAAKGRPGEKLGLFEQGGQSLGSIDNNTSFGIFGNMKHRPMQTYYPNPIPVALAHEVRTGPAYILTVIEGNTIERFSVEILEINRRFDSKGLVVRVSDPRLLDVTNGIVQGMSGSPIIQNGKLIGALTHVYVHNPERGFGVLAEWMVYQAGIPMRQEYEQMQPAA